MFHQVLYWRWIFSFFVVVYFENCFVQTSLQRVSGKHVSSIFLDTGFYWEVCLARISLQRVLAK